MKIQWQLFGTNHSLLTLSAASHHNCTSAIFQRCRKKKRLIRARKHEIRFDNNVRHNVKSNTKVQNIIKDRISIIPDIPNIFAISRT